MHSSRSVLSVSILLNDHNVSIDIQGMGSFKEKESWFDIQALRSSTYTVKWSLIIEFVFVDSLRSIYIVTLKKSHNSNIVNNLLRLKLYSMKTTWFGVKWCSSVLSGMKTNSSPTFLTNAWLLSFRVAITLIFWIFVIVQYILSEFSSSLFQSRLCHFRHVNQ